VEILLKSTVKPVVSNAHYEIGVVTPYRLDLTVSALRRLSTNSVDVLTLEGEYLRALGGFRKPVLMRVAQADPTTLTVTIEGCDGSVEHMRACAIVRRILGVERELSHFYRAAKSVPWL
jgi:DNA-3-methyladenine glycosylase II